MKTYTAKQSDIKRNWHYIDLKGRILGRVAVQIAGKLIGKNKVNYSPNLDNGDYVVAVNAKGIKISGKKEKEKIYYHHPTFPGGLRAYTFEQVFAKDPVKVIVRAVKNMLPKNKLRKDRLARLKVYADDKHPYSNRLQLEKGK